MSFSGKVLLGDLDDFIAPAQACSTGLFSDNPTNGRGTKQLIMEDDFNNEFGYYSMLVFMMKIIPS